MLHHLDTERITIPPNYDEITVCKLWPECQCGDGCAALTAAEKATADRLVKGLIVAVAVVGAVLLYLGTR